MKYLFIFSTLLLLFSGCRRCGECFNFWDGENITFLDEDDNNLLDPSNSEKLEIESFKAADGTDIEFTIKDFSIEPNAPEGIWHIRTVSGVIADKCIGEDCDLFIKFVNQAKPDTFSLRIDKVRLDCCVNYRTSKSQYNHEDITEKHSVVGGFIVRK